ncbi:MULTISPECIES: PLP-dependent aminotransferase family protein [Nocardia]|uniref:MocR-like pyridoxine biosynthesis transcription factor PdxR n=1 Tax=Nocardia TaxID=1817 RepID=UPI000BF18ED9|nr:MULTISPECIES: PLP-dependent aminotransferase family protein [Nocardia]MBF6189096.1 PLP-dependent aminotransferase family protein [Nocardia farcinica]MBF6314886.1 PLP-dependent aminotransferase family protein [Nocardia farcinica]MBF6410087.1 PLP-dependent aminotransferase family protein [Nocardia farcinica]PEH77779.1 GntR family transcriptional regulator [Nocardia sp. FDAARGOS_372]UEX22345.1 PLP-dependent aminotransferase family protein [Nocardia farcinica]
MLDELPIVLDRESPRPLAVQVADALRAAATGGLLRAGDRLPSTRALAQRLAISRSVTAAAYEQLHAEGWIDGRRGSGTYLTTAPAAAPARRDGSTTGTRPGRRYDFAPGAPCVDALDRAAWRRAWRAAADHPPLVRKDRAGDPAYRAAVADHLLRHRGLVAGADTVVLATAGTSAAVGELAAALLRPGDAVAVENPGYQRAIGAFRAAGVRVCPVPVDDHGLRVDLIPAGVRAVYCTPAHQFPLGARMPAARRVQLIEHARRTGALVVEDDYDGELRYDTAPLPLLAALAPDVVVHLGTTSKILSPTLGVGWLVAAPAVAAAVLAHRERTGTSPSPAGQAMLAEFARHGDLARHLRRLRRTVAPRRELVVTALRERGLTVVGDDAGSHVVVPLPDAAAERAAVRAGAAAGLGFDPLGQHHLDGAHQPDGGERTYGIPLGYTALAWADLVTAVPMAAKCLADAAAEGPAGRPTPP